MRRLAALLMAGSLAALPAFGWQNATKTKTNPAGSKTVTMSKSTRTSINTEGNKVLTSSRTKSGKTMTSSRTLTHTKLKAKRIKTKSAAKVKRHTKINKVKSSTRY